MSIEIKFILLTFVISLLQIILLFILGNLSNKSDPKNNFLFSSFVVFVLLIIIFLYFENVSIKTLIGSLLFLLSTSIILFTFWTILIWGFTISLLETLFRIKTASKKEWIKKYCNKKDLNTFTRDRMRLLLIIDAIKFNNKKDILIKKNGIFVSLITNLAKKFVL